jgi:predicted DNA-binding transcriptional regulator AlpA
MSEKVIDFSMIANFCPSPYLSREEVERVTGGLVTAKYLANLDSDGKGPAGRIRLGRKVAYPVQDVIRWLEERTKPVKEHIAKAA